MENCGQLLGYLSKLEEVYLRVKFVVFDEFGKQNFIVEYPVRYQECYEHAELTVVYVSGAESGSVQIRNSILGLSGCALQYPTRIEVRVSFFRKTVAGGLITDVEASPFMVLNERFIISIANRTVLFSGITDKNFISEVSRLINEEKLYCIIAYEDMVIPVTQYTDQSQMYSNTLIYIISVIGGIIGGFAVAGLEVLQMRKYT